MLKGQLSTFCSKTGHYYIDDLGLHLRTRSGKSFQQILNHVVFEVVGVFADDFQSIQDNLLNVDLAGFGQDVDVCAEGSLDGRGAVADCSCGEGALEKH